MNWSRPFARERLGVAALVAVALAIPAPRGACGLSGQDILTKCAGVYDGVRDYTCRVTVATNFPNVRMPTRTFTVYFKQPDKVKVESGGQLVMVPKDVLLFGDVHRHVRDNSKPVLAGQSTRNGRPVYFLKILPKDGRDPERALVWVWGDTWTLKRTEMWRGDHRVLAADWTHMAVGGFTMPKHVSCAVTGGRLAREGKGTVVVDFASWKINSGLSDSIFAEPSKEK